MTKIIKFESKQPQPYRQKMITDKPLDIAWEQARGHIINGDNGWLDIPLTRVVETQGSYHLVAEKRPDLVKFIYAAMEVVKPFSNDVSFLDLAGKTLLCIPVGTWQQADAIMYIWEDALATGVGLRKATKFILDRIGD